MKQDARTNRLLIIMCFACVYAFWGSTYLAIRVVVTEQIPPTVMSAVRCTIAGSLMLLACALFKKKILLPWPVLLRLGAVGILLLTCGNVLLGWGSQHVPSGLSALLFATSPLWMVLVDSVILRGERLRVLGLVGLASGFLGLVILMWPKISAASEIPTHFWLALCALLVAALCWSTGSVLSHRWRLPVDPFVGSGWQVLIAGLVNATIAFTIDDHLRAVWTPQGAGALAYLIVAGSWIGFTCYTWLLQNVPTAKVATFAYVNPIIAVFLGWVLLDEPVDAYVVTGAVVIVASVWLVNSAKVGHEQVSE